MPITERLDFKSAGAVSELFICTARTPWTGQKGRVRHPGAVEGKQHDGWPAGDMVDYHCPHCGHRWQIELPQ